MSTTFSRVLIACDLSKMDEKLFAFTEEVIRNMNVQKIYLTHIIPNFTSVKMTSLDFYQKFTDSVPIDEKVRAILLNKIKDRFKNFKDKIEIDVIEGRPYQQLLHWIELKEIDLAIVGKKKETEGSGITAKRLARNTKASVLFVSDEDTMNFKNILVPIDFSELSATALQTAIQIKNNATSPILIKAVHVVELLPMDENYGLNTNAVYIDALVSKAKESLQKFFVKYNINQEDVESIILPNDIYNVIHHLYGAIRNEELRMVIVGAKGHSVIERIFMGSVTEQLIDRVNTTSMLVVR